MRSISENESRGVFRGAEAVSSTTDAGDAEEGGIALGVVEANRTPAPFRKM